MQNSTCINCGAWYGLHQYETQLCPLNGREEDRPGRAQQWANSKFNEISKNDLIIIERREKLIQSLQDLTPNYTDPDNLESRTQPELIELLIAAAKYWRSQAED